MIKSYNAADIQEGQVCLAEDVSALLAEIHLALYCERKATGIGATVGSGGVIYSKIAIRDARAALDALLSDGDV